jgi:hypothetical protein
MSKRNSNSGQKNATPRIRKETGRRKKLCSNY